MPHSSRFPSLARRLAACVAAAVLAGTASAQTTPLLLTPAERSQVAETLQRAGEAAPAQATDEALVARLLRYAVVELGQRVRPSEIDRTWALEPPRHDVAAEFAAARQAGRLADWLTSLSPPHAGYRALQAAAVRYRAMAAAGGWAALAPGPVLKAGDKGEAVAALRARLAAEGYAAPSAEADVFDAGLKKALSDYQRRHGLEPDGKLSAIARASLNVSIQDRIQQIEANLERWRWLPHQLPADRIEVDIAGAQASLFKGGAPSLSMRIVVGDPKHHTPMFASELEAVVFNPPWNVPSSIAQAELLPKEARNPGYLARNDFVWVDGHLQQRAGPKSALGLLKFDLQSPFGVYLHDTPGRGVFQRRDRALSHGCMRLELPQDLAMRLLAPQGWSEDAVQRAIESKQTMRTPLKTKTPVYVMYWTAVAEPGGAVEFRPDVYGWDHKLSDALAALTLARAETAKGAADCLA